ncbi:hypothetical protein D3C72_598140 [compost metagenome]
MTPALVILILEQAGVRLFLEGDRLRVRAASPDLYTPDLRALVDAHRTGLRAFLARPSPREHFFSLADGSEDIGITGRLGSSATGSLLLAMQAWENAARGRRPDADALRDAYFGIWNEIQSQTRSEV